MVSDFNKKGNRDFFSNKPLFKTFGIIFIIIIVILIIADIRIYQKKRELLRQIDSYKKQIEGLENSNQNLKDEIANVDNIDYLEKLGYEQFGQARPGETEYMFIKPDQTLPEVEKTEKSFGLKSITGWFSNIINWIKNLF